MGNAAEVDSLARVIWDFHQLHQKLEKADIILVLGSHDLRIAEYAAKLFLEGWAPLLVCSGGLGRLTREIWNEPEADKFARIAVAMGVPEHCIITECRSTNTGENITFTRQLLEGRGTEVRKVILVQKPYMERRAYLTFKKVWPELEVTVTSPPITFDDYPDELRQKEDVIGIIVGDLYRLKLYAERGWQAPQEIPKNVWDAYERLVQLGYTQHLVN